MSIHRASAKRPTVDQCSQLLCDIRNIWYYINANIV